MDGLSLAILEIFNKNTFLGWPEKNEFQKLVQFKIHFDWLWHVLGAIYFELGQFGKHYTRLWVKMDRLSLPIVEIFNKNTFLGWAETHTF